VTICSFCTFLYLCEPCMPWPYHKIVLWMCTLDSILEMTCHSDFLHGCERFCEACVPSLDFTRQLALLTLQCEPHCELRFLFRFGPVREWLPKMFVYCQRCQRFSPAILFISLGSRISCIESDHAWKPEENSAMAAG
jgi:hypothetical protein